MVTIIMLDDVVALPFLVFLFKAYTPVNNIGSSTLGEKSVYYEVRT